MPPRLRVLRRGHVRELRGWQHYMEVSAVHRGALAWADSGGHQTARFAWTRSTGWRARGC
eukprot:3893073-Rhodomonas_salina.3